MSYSDLVRLYFDRSTALQWYWTIYVVVLGGLLAFSSLRQRPAMVTTLLVSVLYICFAYKNCGAIGDVTEQRLAIVKVIREYPLDRSTPSQASRSTVEPTLVAPPFEGLRNFHYACDALTIAAIWAMEVRRRRLKGHAPAAH